MISYFRTKYLISHLIMVLITLVLPCPSTANTMNGSMDFDKTVAVVTDTSPEDGSTEMIILTKEGTSYSLSDGTWDLNQLDAPGPHWFRGYAVATSGTYILNGIDSENTPFNGTGTISIAADGSVSITTPGSPFQCHLDSGKTVMACTATQADDSSSLLVMTRRGTSSSFADLAFTWDLNVLSSPGPSWMRGTIIVDTLGNFVMSGTDYQGNTQGASGTTSINAPDGIISFTQTLPSPKQPFPCTLDAGKTVMACTKSSNAGASSDLLIMTKRAPSYLSGDLTGVWHSHSLATGASQWWSSGVLTFLTGGFFNGSGTGYGGGTWDTSGVASISTSGLVIHTDDFTATPVLGGAPLIVNFTDATVHNPTSWLWQFDDGTTSTEQNPMHIFTLAGSYDVALTAITAGVPVFVTKTGFINVSTCGAKPVNRSGSFYDLIYDGCHYASVNGQTLQMQGIILIQNPVLDNNYAIKLIGGYDCIYSSNPGWTTINGKLTIKGKSVIVEKVKIK